MNGANRSIGTGRIVVLLCSLEISFSALLATGHFTYMPSADHPSLRYGTHHNDERKEIFTSHVPEMDRLSHGFPVFG